MKRKVILLAVCLMLVVSTVVAPLSASASVWKIMKINVSGARLRTGPGDYPWTKSLKKGTQVLYKGKSSKAFYQVTTKDGTTGWVYKEYLSNYGAVNSSQVYRTRSSAKLYKSPSTSAHRVTTVSSGAYVLVYATRGGWAYVKTTSGKGGYMKTSSLKKA